MTVGLNEIKVLRTQVQEWVVEATELRFGVAGDPDGVLVAPPVSASASDVLGTLLRVRNRLDRIDELLAKALRTKAYVANYVFMARAAADETWSLALVEARNAPVRRGDEFQGPRERYADADLASLTQRREANAAEVLQRYVDSGVESIRVLQRNLDGFRSDLLAWLRSIQFESHLER